MEKVYRSLCIWIQNRKKIVKNRKWKKSIEVHAYYTPHPTTYFRYSKHTSCRDLVHAALFSKDFPKVPLHEAVGMAASASAETGLDVDEMDVEDLEDLGELKKR